jgi:hypothetical protein
LTNNELERKWVEAVVADFATPFHICLGEVRKTMKILREDNRLFIRRETFFTTADYFGAMALKTV